MEGPRSISSIMCKAKLIWTYSLGTLNKEALLPVLVIQLQFHWLVLLAGRGSSNALFDTLLFSLKLLFRRGILCFLFVSLLPWCVVLQQNVFSLETNYFEFLVTFKWSSGKSRSTFSREAMPLSKIMLSSEKCSLGVWKEGCSVTWNELRCVSFHSSWKRKCEFQPFLP